MGQPSTFICAPACPAPRNVTNGYDVGCWDNTGTIADMIEPGRFGEICRGRCLPGYTPTPAQLHCIPGVAPVLEPPTFECPPSDCRWPHFEFEHNWRGTGGWPGMVGDDWSMLNGTGCLEGGVIAHGTSCTVVCNAGYTSPVSESQCR